MDFLKKIFYSEEVGDMHRPDSGQFSFELSHVDDKIGYLEFIDGCWNFEYSDFFKNQNNLHPIIDFPDKSKAYKSEVLWPYFASRVPSIETPYVQKRVKKNNIDSKNLVEMLSEFGKKTITSPFVLNFKD